MLFLIRHLTSGAPTSSIASQRDSVPLHLAAEQGHAAAVAALLESGATTDARDRVRRLDRLPLLRLPRSSA